jgi:hypothetical protein
MVTLYVGGQKVSWADAERVLAEPAALAGRVELRNDAGRVVARLVSEPPADDPDWEAAITPEETQRRMAGPFLTLDEYRKQAGGQ